MFLLAFTALRPKLWAIQALQVRLVRNPIDYTQLHLPFKTESRNSNPTRNLASHITNVQLKAMFDFVSSEDKREKLEGKQKSREAKMWIIRFSEDRYAELLLTVQGLLLRATAPLRKAMNHELIHRI